MSKDNKSEVKWVDHNKKKEIDSKSGNDNVEIVKCNSLFRTIVIEGIPITMEIDTGASVTVISDKLLTEKFPKQKK